MAGRENQGDLWDHLESCTPERKQANWNVLVCTGTYQSVPVPASTRIPRLVQASTRWYKSVPDFPNMYTMVQDGTEHDSTSRYRNIIYST